MPSRTFFLRVSWFVCLLGGCTVHSYSMHAEAHAETGTHSARQAPRHATHDRRDHEHERDRDRDRDRDHDHESGHQAARPSGADKTRDGDDARHGDDAHGDTINRGRDLTAGGPRIEAHPSPAADKPSTPEAGGASNTEREHAKADADNARAATDKAAADKAAADKAAADAKKERDAARTAELERQAKERRKRDEIKKVRDVQAAAGATTRTDELEIVDRDRQPAENTRQQRLAAAVKRAHDEKAQRERDRQKKVAAAVKQDKEGTGERAKPDAGDRMRLIMAR